MAYDAIEASAGSSARGTKRLRVVGAFVALAMVVCVAFIGAQQGGKRSELIIRFPEHVGLNKLADHILRHGAQMSVAQMAQVMKEWTPSAPDPANHLSPQAVELLAQEKQGAKTQMLANFGSMLDEGESHLCAKKDLILGKFDQLLRKLGGEELSLNISLGLMGAEWHAAMESWLDSESTYRLRIEQTKEASNGLNFAQQQYEKYRQAQKEAKANYLSGLKSHDLERQDLIGERELIKEIMRFIGVLHDVTATEKSFAAGGRDSIKDSETGVSDYYGTYKAKKSRAELEGKIAELSQLLKESKTPGALQKLALLKTHTSKLAVYSETVEVVNILKQMLDDIKTRHDIIDKVDDEAKKLVDDVTNSMIEWEGKLQQLGSAMDKAKALKESAKLERKKLSGDNLVVETAATEANKAGRIMIPPYEREIYVITMIKKKIIDKCAGE